MKQVEDFAHPAQYTHYITGWDAWFMHEGGAPTSPYGDDFWAADLWLTGFNDARKSWPNGAPTGTRNGKN